MSWIKSLFLSSLALFLFFGTVGIDIFSHFCDEDGMEISYFVEDDSICDAHKHKQDDHDQKHQEEECCDEQEENNCCNTTATHIQVKLDFTQNILIKPILLSQGATTPVWYYETEFPTEVIEQASGTDPPPLEEQTRLAKIQKWLI